MKHLILIFSVLVGMMANAKTRSGQCDFLANWFMSLVSIDSQSSYPDDMTTFSINPGQGEVADFVVENLLSLYPEYISEGKLIIAVSDWGYVYIHLPSNHYLGNSFHNGDVADKETESSSPTPSIMFMAHLDVTPEAPGGKVTPIRHDNYDGADLLLPGGVTLSPSTAYGRHLNDCSGKTVITSDGSTLLGADDKAGCTVLLGLVDQLLTTDTPHGDVYVVLTQNEDIGMAADGLQLSYIGGKSPDLIIDVDGDEPGVLSIGNFTAVGRRYVFHGNNVHPGDGKKDGYADALTAAAMFIGQMPSDKHPSSSEGEQGYIHCYSLRHPSDSQGNAISTDYMVDIRLRYFDKEEGQGLRKIMDKAAQTVAEAYPNVVVEAVPEVLQYENIAYTMHPELPKIISIAAENIGMPVRSTTTRGGTTASMMAAKGLNGGPCLYSGQNAPHSCYEWTCVEDMMEVCNLCISIVKEVSKL